MTYHRKLSSSVLITNRYIAFQHHYHTSQPNKSTKKPKTHEPTTTPKSQESHGRKYHFSPISDTITHLTHLIYKIAKSRNFETVDQILLIVRYRNVICKESLFMGLIQHYGKTNSVDKAVDVFNRMTSFDCVRTIPSLNNLINVLVDCNELEKASSFFDGAKDMRLRLNLVSFNILIKGFLDKCDWEGACKVFDEMLETEVQQSVMTYNSLIGFLCRSNDLVKAKSFFEDMIQKRIRLNAVTFALLMRGLYCKGEYSEAKKLMFDMEYRGCKLGLFHYGVL